MTTVWAISDTHLSLARPRDQTCFGARWQNHTARLEAAWHAHIGPEDIVLLPGDLSWAHSSQYVRPDVEWLAALPGCKVLVRGNHDYWWKRLSQVRREVLLDGVYAVQGSCLALNGMLVCGTMGHIAPNDPYFQKHKYQSYQREVHWLRSALEQAHQMRGNGEPVLLMMHYPPYTSEGLPTGFTTIIAEYAPAVCVYGHLHLEHEWAAATDGLRDGVRYHLVASDYLDMVPRRVWPPDPDQLTKGAPDVQR